MADRALVTASVTVPLRLVIIGGVALAALAIGGCARAHDPSNPFVGPKGALDTPFGWHSSPAAPRHS